MGDRPAAVRPAAAETTGEAPDTPSAPPARDRGRGRPLAETRREAGFPTQAGALPGDEGGAAEPRDAGPPAPPRLPALRAQPLRREAEAPPPLQPPVFPQVRIGRVEVFIAAPAAGAPRGAAPETSSLASRRYLRRA